MRSMHIDFRFFLKLTLYLYIKSDTVKKSIIKKLVIFLLFSITAISFKEKLCRWVLPLNTVNSPASENNNRNIKIQFAKIGFFSLYTRFVTPINERSILKKVKEIEVIPLT